MATRRRAARSRCIRITSLSASVANAPTLRPSSRVAACASNMPPCSRSSSIVLAHSACSSGLTGGSHAPAGAVSAGLRRFGSPAARTFHMRVPIALKLAPLASVPSVRVLPRKSPSSSSMKARRSPGSSSRISHNARSTRIRSTGASAMYCRISAPLPGVYGLGPSATHRQCTASLRATASGQLWCVKDVRGCIPRSSAMCVSPKSSSGARARSASSSAASVSRSGMLSCSRNVAKKSITDTHSQRSRRRTASSAENSKSLMLLSNLALVACTPPFPTLFLLPLSAQSPARSELPTAECPPRRLERLGAVLLPLVPPVRRLDCVQTPLYLLRFVGHEDRRVAEIEIGL
mmetsp:Transcript_29857/g.97226  ORF Transcript_29857/g.97226 Transcript_29857/m.97226 type:complete len:348 (-) Transcript_29857:227-1270(-)